MNDGSLFDKSTWGDSATVEPKPYEPLDQEINRLRCQLTTTRRRLEELERVRETVGGISTLFHLSEEVRQTTIAALVKEALDGEGERPKSLIERVRYESDE